MNHRDTPILRTVYEMCNTRIPHTTRFYSASVSEYFALRWRTGRRFGKSVSARLHRRQSTTAATKAAVAVHTQTATHNSMHVSVFSFYKQRRRHNLHATIITLTMNVETSHHADGTARYNLISIDEIVVPPHHTRTEFRTATSNARDVRSTANHNAQEHYFFNFN